METVSANELSVSTPTDIAIIGGGMVGAALAALLSAANSDWQITLIEGFPLPAAGQPIYQPSFDVRSTAIAAGSVDLLQQAGVWSRLQEHATTIEQVHVSERGHVGGTVIDGYGLEEDGLGYVIANQWIGNVLLDHLRQQTNVTCLAPAKVRQLTPDAGGAVLTIETAEEVFELQTSLAVIADGAQSGLRSQLGIEIDTFDYRQTAVIANVAFELPHRGVAYERFTEQGPLALLPLGESRNAKESALVWTHPSAGAAEVLAISDEEFLARLQQRFGYRLGRFTLAGKRESYPLHRILAREQVRSSVVVMGNAAHFLHPVAGQGFNLALRDCAALAQRLSKARQQGQRLGELSVLQAYVDDQSHDQWLTVQGSDRLTRLFSNDSLPLAALRALGFMGLNSLPAAKRWLSEQSMGRGGHKIQIGSPQGD